MALRFVLSHAAVSTTIVGMRKSQHVRENTALSDSDAMSVDLLQELKRHRWEVCQLFCVNDQVLFLGMGSGEGGNRFPSLSL